MNHNLIAERPPEFTDDERWWRFFTRKSLSVLILSAFVFYISYRIFRIVNMGGFGIVIGIIFIAASLLLVSVPIPGNDIFRGCGMTLDQMLFRKIVRGQKAAVYRKRTEDTTGSMESGSN